MIETILNYAVNYGKENLLEILLTIAMIYNLLKGNHAQAEACKELKQKNKTQNKIKKLENKQEKAKAKAIDRQNKISELKGDKENVKSD